MEVLVKCPNPRCTKKRLRACPADLQQVVRCLHCQVTFTLSPRHLLRDGPTWPVRLRRGAGAALAALLPAGLGQWFRPEPLPAPEDDGPATDLVSLADHGIHLTPDPGPRPTRRRSTLSHAAQTTDGGEPPAPPPSGLPRQIARFLVRGRLGGGNFGTVYQAYDPQLDREVALKVPRGGVLETPERIQRFLGDARSAARLRHPHIVPVYDAGQDGPLFYIASALVRGRTLAEAGREGALDFRRSAAVVRDLAEALAYAHGLGIIHRDVKPANILLDEQGRPHLIDFGLAYRQDSAGQAAEPRPDSEPEDGARLTQDGFIVGTPAYMAPEHARGRRGDVEAPSDQYSLGVVLYELLCGHVPFEGPVQVILFNHLRTPPEPPREVNPAVPRDLEAICLKAMAKRPADRYPTCREMADDLRRFLEHEPVRARRMGPVERTRRWCRREPALAGALLAIGVLSLLFGVIMWRVAAHARHEEGRARGEEIRAGENADRAAKNEREARSNLAGSRLDRALDLCKQGEVGQGLVRMSEALKLADEAGDEDLRRVIEWNLAGWRRQLPSLKSVMTQQGPVRALALGPRGELLVTGGAGPRGNGAQVWEVRTGQPRALLPHDRPVLAVGFSPDGSKVVTGSADGSARVWDLRAAKVLVECKHPHAVHAVAWSPDGKLLLTGSGTADGPAGEARLWDAADGTPRGEPMRHAGPVYAVAFSRDGTQFATGGGTTFRGEARVWNAATGEPIPYDTPLHHAGAVNALAFSPDGTLLLTGSGSLFKGQAQLWDVATGKPHGKALSDGLEIYAVAFSPDGKTVAAAGQDRTARLWDAETGQPVGSPLWHTKDVVAVAFSPDGRTVVTGGDDRTVRLWEAVAHRPYAARFDHGGAILAAAVAPDGKTFLTGSVTPLGTGEARLYPMGPGKRLERIAHGRPVSAVAFSRDGSRLATGTWDGEVRLWDPRHLRDGQGGPRPLLGGKLPGGERVQALAFRPDGRAVLVGGWEGALLLWDLDNGAMRPVPGGHGRIFAVAFSPDGKTFLTGSRDETARLWDAETLQQLHTFRHPDAVLSVAFSPDGGRILTGYAGATLLWDARTRERLGLPFLHQAGVFGAAFGPGGRTIVTGGTDKAARVWDVATHKPIGPPLAHEGAVLAAAFAPDGRTVLTAGLDRTARLWNVWEPMTEEAERTRLWAEVVTGIELDGRGVIHVLDGAGWDRRRGELAGQGGPPAVERAVAEELKGQPDVEVPESVPNPRLARRPPPPLPPPPRPAPEPEPVREERVRPENLIDPGAEILLSLDVRQLMKLPGVKKYAAAELKKVLGKNEGLRALLNVAVRKPLDDIASVLLVSSGGVDRTLVIVRGEFDYPGMRAAAEKFARGQPGGLKMSLQEGVPFWEVEAGGRPLFAALAGPSALVLAPSREYLVWELRAARRPRAPLGGRMRAALADRAGGEAVWLAVAVTEEMKGRLGEGNPALQEFAARVQSMSAGVTQVKDLVRLDVRLHTAGLRATYQVEEYIDNVKSTLGDLLMGNGDAGRALNDLLGKIEVWKDRTTHTVKLSLKLPPDALGALPAALR